MPKTPVVLALGGNLGDREANIRSAIDAIGAIAGVKVRKVSPLVESLAVTLDGVDESAPRYLNAVVLADTSLKPKALLAELHRIETEHGRVRFSRWDSRTLDIDIVTYGTELKSTKALTLPHPRAHQRAFVLVPWLEVDPDAVLPGYGLVKDLVPALEDRVEVLQ